MKNRVAFLFLFAALIASPLIQAQTPATPIDARTLKTDADFAKYEGKVKEYVSWYIKTAVDKDTTLHKQIAGFLVAWITGAPNVSVAIGGVAMPIINEKNDKYNTDLLVAYMGGITVYELNNPKDKDETNIQIAGVQAVLELAKNNSTLLANSEAVKKYKGMDNAALTKWVKETLASSK